MMKKPPAHRVNGMRRAMRRMRMGNGHVERRVIRRLRSLVSGKRSLMKMLQTRSWRDMWDH